MKFRMNLDGQEECGIQIYNTHIQVWNSDTIPQYIIYGHRRASARQGCSEEILGIITIRLLANYMSANICSKSSKLEKQSESADLRQESFITPI